MAKPERVTELMRGDILDIESVRITGRAGEELKPSVPNTISVSISLQPLNHE